MSWTHAICDECWAELNGTREPNRLRDPDEERCCRCSETTDSGIFVRADPATLRCGGRHD